VNDINAGKLLCKRLATRFLACVGRNRDLLIRVGFLLNDLFGFIKQVDLKTFIDNIFFRPSAEKLILKITHFF
jgi:hypothetical protein